MQCNGMYERKIVRCWHGRHSP